eukprot:681938-Prymnesium_polylepis.1
MQSVRDWVAEGPTKKGRSNSVGMFRNLVDAAAAGVAAAVADAVSSPPQGSLPTRMADPEVQP